MNKLLAVAVILLLFTSMLMHQIKTANSNLVISAKLPYKFTQGAAIWDGNNAYVFGGGSEAGPKNTIVRYNPTSGQVSVMTATLPERVTDNCAIWNGRYAFIFGGWTGQPIFSNKISRYDPTTDTITVMSAQLPTYSMSAVWDGTNAYLFGGYDGYSCYSHILRYSPSTDQLTTMKAKLPTGIKWTSAVWTGTYAYIFGGYPYSDQIVRYDPTADSVTAMTSKLPQKLIFTSAVWTGTYALIFGGASASNIMSEIVKFEPSQGSITIMDETLPTPRLATSAIWDGNNAYLFGGNTHDATGDIAYDDIIKYTPPGTQAPAEVSISTPTIMNNLDLIDDFDSFFAATMPSGVFCDVDVSVRVSPSNLVKTVQVKTGGTTYPDVFLMTKGEGDIYTVRLRIPDPNTWKDFVWAYAIALANIGEVVDLPDIVWHQPKVSSILVTDINGQLYEESFNIDLPTIQNILPLIYQGSTTIMMLCPVDLLISDSHNQSIGAVYENGVLKETVNTIQGAYYFGDYGSDSMKMFYLPFSAESYKISGYAFESGSYNMTVLTVLNQQSPTDVVSQSGNVNAGDRLDCSLSLAPSGRTELSEIAVSSTSPAGIFLPMEAVYVIAVVVIVAIIAVTLILWRRK